MINLPYKANEWISAHSPYRPAWQAFRDGRYTLCVSNDILSEDAHFRVLADVPFPSVNVIRLDEFLQDLATLNTPTHNSIFGIQNEHA